MKRMACLCVLFCLVGVVSGEPWTLGVAGNDDSISVLGGVRPTPHARTEFRVEFGYLDGISGGKVEAVMLGVGATYDALQDVNLPFEFPFNLGSAVIKMTGYIGGTVGVCANIHGQTDYDAIALAIVGVSAGDERNRLGLELSLPLNKELWSGLADLENMSNLRLVLIHRF